MIYSNYVMVVMVSMFSSEQASHPLQLLTNKILYCAESIPKLQKVIALSQSQFLLLLVLQSSSINLKENEELRKKVQELTKQLENPHKLCEINGDGDGY